MWKWYQYLVSNVAEGKTVLNISLDETSVQLWQARHCGNISFREHRTIAGVRKRLYSDVTLKAQRSNITHVALVCDNREIQKCLPQFLIVNEQVLLKREVPLVKAFLPSNVFLIRAKSSWNNTRIMLLILQKLVEALAGIMENYQPIIFWDSAPCHLHGSLYDYCKEHDIFVGVIPGSLTWLLQVLDVSIFSHYKRYFKVNFHHLRSKSRSGHLSTVEVFRLIVSCIRAVLEGKDWAFAFGSAGFAPNRDQVSQFILENLRMDRVPAIEVGMPSLAELRILWPKTRSPPYTSLFNIVPPGSPLLALPPPLPVGRVFALPASASASPLNQRVASWCSSSPDALLEQFLVSQDHIYAWLGERNDIPGSV